MDIAKLYDKVFPVLLVWLLYLSVSLCAAENVYFDKFGHCLRPDPFDLSNEEYLLKHVGGGFVHETLVCDITFKAPLGYGVCLDFEQLEINDCSVRLQIYASSSSSGQPWRILDCNESGLSHMCTSTRYVTVRVIKDKLNYNRGYAFEIRVTKSTNINEKGVLFASFGVLMAVILGAVLLTAIFAVSIIYCCCCKRRAKSKTKTAETAETFGLDSPHHLQPSAPPVDNEDHLLATTSRGQFYTQSCYDPYPLQYPPPPYMPPPPYQAEFSKKEIDQQPDHQIYPIK